MSPYACRLILVIAAIGLKVAAEREYEYLTDIPVYQYDDYGLCIVRKSTYCFTKTVLRPREEDNLPSKHIRVDFRKSLLEWGICAKECDEETELLTKNERDVLRDARFPLGNIYKIPRRYYPDMDWMESLFGEKIHVCVNNRLRQIYNVSGYPIIETCITTRFNPWKSEFDWYECIFFIVVFSYFVAFTISNVLDLCGPNFFKGFLIIRACSFRTNCVRLLNWSRDEYDADFRCMNTLRFILTVLLVGLNCFLLVISFPVPNPESVEEYMRSPAVINTLCCLFWIIPVFLTMDGFTMMVHYLDSRTRKQTVDIGYFRQAFVLWMIEIFPLYFVAMLYSTVTDTIWGTEPNVGRFFMITRESLCCRENLWANLLFMNNYPVTQEMCYVHGWYLAATIQLFLGAVAVLWITSRYRTWKIFLLWIVPALAICMPGIWVFAFGTEPLPPLRLNDISSQFMYQRWFRHMYIPTHMNAGNYIVGMMAGYYFYQVRVYDVNPAKFKIYQYTKRFVFPITVATGLIPYLFYTQDLVEPTILSSGYAILFQNICSVYCAICIFENFQNLPDIVRRIFDTKYLVIPSRLWYGLFVTHIIVLRSYLSLREPWQEFDANKFPKVFGRILVLSFLLSIGTYLVVEQPTRRFLSKKIYPNLPRDRKPDGMRFELYDLEIGFGSSLR
ncbi:uncharacterized protein LOC129770322 [Toxorhynchites rutilus septentrionalis]|uniref:uncharacterized protein LOC129770322 n=1 Tax=Toxorhynchites rutilus septentrionalis TaxID=329112 RepID=UPI00247AE052|nr:uncharacterized protein LOC129770322 [Toxorhynchites rutilus septentrionalis]